MPATRFRCLQSTPKFRWYVIRTVATVKPGFTIKAKVGQFSVLRGNLKFGFEVAAVGYHRPILGFCLWLCRQRRCEAVACSISKLARRSI
jgi:hypothetical protein